MKVQGPGVSFLLVLILALLYRPGVCQFGGNLKHCCARSKTHNPNQEDFSSFVQNGNYKICPHNKVQFKLNNKELCLNKDEWVNKVIRCIDEGRDECLKSSDPEANKEFSKGGSNVQPVTSPKPQTSTSSKDVFTEKAERNEAIKSTEPYIYTTPKARLNTESPNINLDQHLQGSDKQLPTTTGPSTTFSSKIEVPTQRRNVDQHEPNKVAEKIVTTMANGGLRTPSADYNPNGNDRLHDNGPSVKENDDKIKEMRTTIIILIGIILVGMAIGTGVYCWKRRGDRCNLPFDGRHQGYKSTKTDDTKV